MQTTTKTLAAFSALALMAGTAQAETLFADTFDRADNTDLNAATAGKSGSLGALNWVEVKSGGEPVIAGNELLIGETGAGGGWSIAYLDHNFTDGIITTGGEFTVSVELPGTQGTGGSTRFLGFGVGSSLTDVSGWSTNNPTTGAGFPTDFFFGYDPTTGGAARGTYVFTDDTTPDFFDSTNRNSGPITLSARFTSISDFNAGSSVNYEAFINGASVKTGSFTWSGTNENYINVYSNYTAMQGDLDNFSVTAVPEPASLVLLGLGGLLFARRRRG